MTRYLLALAVVAAIGTGCASGSQSAVAEQARAIEAQVWSPYCPGRLLIDCTTRQARELRSDIEERLTRGDAPDEVMAWITRNHGIEALARPPATGSGVAVWIVPAALLAAGGVMVTVLVRRWSRRSTDVAPPGEGSAGKENLVARLRDEVEGGL